MQLKIYIAKGDSTEEITRQFNFYYPYLKIEFYKRPFIKQQHGPKKDAAEVIASLSPLTQFTCDGTLNISSSRTVRELESDMNSLGLYGQVLRKSGQMWIETYLTNDWTLQQQNYEGEQISKLHDQGFISSL